MLYRARPLTIRRSCRVWEVEVIILMISRVRSGLLVDGSHKQRHDKVGRALILLDVVIVSGAAKA